MRFREAKKLKNGDSVRRNKDGKTMHVVTIEIKYSMLKPKKNKVFIMLEDGRWYLHTEIAKENIYEATK